MQPSSSWSPSGLTAQLLADVRAIPGFAAPVALLPEWPEAWRLPILERLQGNPLALLHDTLTENRKRSELGMPATRSTDPRLTIAPIMAPHQIVPGRLSFLNPGQETRLAY